MSKRNPKLYVDDILAAISQIEEYTKNLTFEKFLVDQKTIDAVIRNFTIIGEAAKNIPDDMKTQYRKIPWIEIMGMRDKIIHEYFGVDEIILWKTVTEDIPVFKKQIGELAGKF